MKSHLLALLLLASSTSLAGAAGQKVDVVLNEGCMCCHEWITHMQAAGYAVTSTELDYDAITAKKKEVGIPEDAVSCHTAMVGGYAIFEMQNKEEAVASAMSFMQMHADHMPGWEGTCEIRAMAGDDFEAGCPVSVATAADA